MNIIPYGRQSITEKDISSVIEALTSDFLTQGPRIAAFEESFAKYIGSRYAVALSNGTAALHLSAMALNVNSATNVITTPITFAASANCVRYCNGNIFFADIDPQNYCLDIEKVRTLILSKPPGFFHGIIPVDFAGFPVNLEMYRLLAKEFNLWILEDACHAPGGYFIDSTKDIQQCGNGKYADLAIFSFHPVKHIACGEGGMITTDNEELYRKLLLLRTHGITKDPGLMHENHGGWYYEMLELGYNYRLTDIQAALGISQLAEAGPRLKRRREIAARYYDAFKDKEYIKGQSGVIEGHAYHLYIIEIDERKNLYEYLRTKNIFCQVHYIPVHTLPYYQELGYKKGELPNAEKYYSRCLSLPMFPALTDEQQDFVINEIAHFFNE